MKNHFLAITLSLLVICTSDLFALNYPGIAPGTAVQTITKDHLILENSVMRAQWKIEDGRISSLDVVNKQSNQPLIIATHCLPRVVLDKDHVVNLASLRPIKPIHLDGNVASATFKDKTSGLSIKWSVTLSDNSNAVIQTLQLAASRDTKIEEIVFLDTALKNARQVGEVDGSVVICGNIFLGVEHPLAKNTVGKQSTVRCTLPRGNVLKPGQSWTQTSVIGVVPPGQLRRGFLYYLERRRAQPYRPFLHYNNWYDVILARPSERITEPECLEAIECYGRELVNKRGVKMDAFVWDDGWDKFNSLWDFHKGFPDGFKNLNTAASKYGVAQGVWMSPNGGYASAKDKRITFGKSQGYETNSMGFAMGGAKYQKAFRDVCLKMIRDNGVTFFKFDGMGGGGEATGAEAELADDIDGVLNLSRALRREKPDVFISATAGTWASPFWTLYADSIWRQGKDNGLFGKGDTRQQWITYRDKFCYERIVKLGPLYPLNSLMLGGILIGERRAPAQFVRNEKSIADETWSFFGSGTNLQELYVNPKLPTETTWDVIAAAAKWSRANSHILVDTHWVGGDPAKAEIYGWASWQPGKGILTLRNPSDQPQSFNTTLQTALELPDAAKERMTAKVQYPLGRKLPANVLNQKLQAQQSISLTLQPFEVIVIELHNSP